MGWLKGFDQYPDLSRLLARLVLEVDPTATFTSIWVSHNSMRPLHQDLNNDEWTSNYVIPLSAPDSGGELWTELSPGDRVYGPITMRTGPGGREVYGQLHTLEVGSCIKFNPRRFHEVQVWKGSRTVLVAYTPQCLGKLDYKDIQSLNEHGFPPPLSQLPEAFGGQPQAFLGKTAAQADDSGGNAADQEGGADDTSSWELFMEVDKGMVKIGDDMGVAMDEGRPSLSKAEVGYTANVERILANLTGPLEVTYTVDPREVLQNLAAWEPAIRKEVKTVEIAIQRLMREGDLAVEARSSTVAI